MSNSWNVIKYVKHNKVRIKTDIKRQEMTKVLLEFFGELEEKPTGMRGFMIMDDLKDVQEFIVLTFWERKEDMDSFYESYKPLGDLVEKLKPSFEQPPIMKDYRVAKFKVC